ncbi:NADPH-dependent F420 reductase [Lactococcus lactis]|uniref:NADPH-dependent F420 reductase n=1 Tax=Lactococcus lactis TaxID=1358 RepID=A0A552Z2J3_9LACT|nr:NADPH-dependent F420 reductase [Lactococcus lactis]MCT0078150.1 diguanylate cyclase [Lactococcus lactis subsp. lactis]MCT0440636.1 diguanylate cyclase [Lactococcus lactis subsp. lactis]TRW73736.1 NADPH-dependent F420 reductase [Lactococcus lactis]
MATISIFGKGKMGKAIGDKFSSSGNKVNYILSNSSKTELGEIVVLAVPYVAIAGIIQEYSTDLQGKIIIDITNPVDFTTFDSLLVPSDTSAAALIAKQLPNSMIVKAFNTTFSDTLATKKVANEHQTTVLLASDSQEAKETIIKSLENSGLSLLDAGSLKRARELEAIGFLQITLAASEKISWDGGFGIFK